MRFILLTSLINQLLALPTMKFLIDNYTSISFDMGLDTAKNISNKYVNESFIQQCFGQNQMEEDIIT